MYYRPDNDSIAHEMDRKNSVVNLWMGTKMVQLETGKYGWSVVTVDGDTLVGRVQRFRFF
jgi:hypothetical protein